MNALELIAIFVRQYLYFFIFKFKTWLETWQWIQPVIALLYTNS